MRLDYSKVLLSYLINFSAFPVKVNNVAKRADCVRTKYESKDTEPTFLVADAHLAINIQQVGICYLVR